MTFQKELTSLINRYSRENKSNTPDFLLAEYMNECLLIFERIIAKRDGTRIRKTTTLTSNFPFFSPVSTTPTAPNIHPQISSK